LNESAEARDPKEFAVVKPLTTVGRRGFNDVVVVHRSVSGEHALIRREGDCYFIEDLNSTNGTFVNGEFVKRHLLNHDDKVELGGCVLRFRTDDAAAATPGAAPEPDTGPPTTSATMPQTLGQQPALIKVLSGEAAGRELLLTKVVTTIGKPGVQLASVSRRPSGFVLTHLQGRNRPVVNGVAMNQDVLIIRSGDVIELSGTQMRLISD
jgi:pSer/pThr/pTyr-binding forkhead associated (FHA) protein